MQNPPMLLAFLQELFKRFATKSPKFFKIWQIISGALALITGVPEFLEFIGVALPPEIDFLANKFISACSSGAFFMSLLTTQSQTVGLTHEGEVVKKTNEARLPFTAAIESKAAEKMPDAPKVLIEGKTDDTNSTPNDNQT